MNDGKCLLASKCKKAGDPEKCNDLCYPYVRLHGEKGAGGIVGIANVPKAYRQSLPSNLPFKEDNPDAFRLLTIYCKAVVQKVDEGLGLYLYGMPHQGNPRGCGNGKTTAATAVLNEYLTERVILDVKKARRIHDVPGLFVNVSKFQNMYNAQFRGTKDMQAEASQVYYQFKRLMLKVPLLVMDDIGIRDATDAFRNEFYEVIDDRAIEQLATLYTSNVPIEKIAEILDDRISSRIEGSTFPIGFKGEDKRRKAL